MTLFKSCGYIRQRMFKERVAMEKQNKKDIRKNMNINR